MLRNLIFRKFLQQEKYLDQFYNSIIKLREKKSHRRRRPTPAPAVYSAVQRECTTPTVQIGVVRIDQCSPGSRRERLLTLLIADSSVNQYWGVGTLISLDLSYKYQILLCWTNAANLRTILGAKYQMMRLQIVKIIFFLSQILIKSSVSAFPESKNIFSVSGWFCISTRIYCFESFSLIILFSRLLLQWQSQQQQQLVNEIQNNRFFQIIFSHLLVKNIIGLEYNCLVCLCKSMSVCLHLHVQGK